jgi:hypothetical protein
LLGFTSRIGFRHHIELILLIFAFFAVGGFHQARAQLAGAPSAQTSVTWGGVEVLAQPYLWLPWTNVSAQTARASASDTIGAGDLISHLTWVPFMGAAEFRNGAWGLMADYIHAPIKSGIGTRKILFGSDQGQLTLDTGTAILFYRTVVSPDQYVDLGVGVRAWGIDGGIALNQGLLPAVTVTKGLAWADPLIAARYHRDLGNGLSATAYGDVGGFGAGANIDWQLIGTIDYAIRPGVDLHAGFRSLNFNIGSTPVSSTVHMYGPIISATFRF